MIFAVRHRDHEPLCGGGEQHLQFRHRRVAVGQGALEVVEDHQRGMFPQGLGDGFDFVALVNLEILLHQGVTQLVQHELEAGSVSKERNAARSKR